MSNDNNDQKHNAHLGQSADWNAEAKALARASAAERQSASQSRPLPPQSNVIPDSALPPGLSAAEKQEYIARMVGRSTASTPRDYSSSTDYTGSVPRLDPKDIEPWSPWGSTRSLANLEPNGTVQIAGTRITAEHAVRLGILQRDPAGGYKLPTDAESAVREDAEKQANEPQEETPKGDLASRQADGETPDNDAMIAIMAVKEAVEPEVYSAIVRDVVTHNGTLSMTHVVEAGARAGLDAEQAQSAASEAYNGYKRQAEAAARSAGVAQSDMNELWTWAADKYKAEHGHAVMSLLQGGGVAAIKGLAKKFAAYRRGNR